MRPAIALDATQIMLEARTGNRRVWMNLIPALAEAAPDLDILVWMGYWRAVAGNVAPRWAQPNVRNRTLRLPRRLIEAAWDRGLLAVECMLPRARLFHSIFRYVPPSWSRPRILTAYDVREVIFPDLYSRTAERTRQRLIRDLRRAEVVIAPSRAVAREIESHFPARRGRLVTLRAGAVEPLFSEPPRDRGILERLGVRGRYFVTIGSGDPRKNIPHLVRTFAEVPGEAALVVVGAPHPSYEAVRGNPRIVFTGLVTDEEWRDLLAFSEALIYPSLYEGFGLPSLEAMAAGTVLVASTAVPVAVEELAAECLLFEPRSGPELAAALAAVEAMSPERRAELLAAGRARAATFTWARVASDYLQLYREVLAG